MKRQNIEYILILELKLWSESPIHSIEIECFDFDLISKAVRED